MDIKSVRVRANFYSPKVPKRVIALTLINIESYYDKLKQLSLLFLIILLLWCHEFFFLLWWIMTGGNFKLFQSWTSNKSEHVRTIHETKKWNFNEWINDGHHINFRIFGRIMILIRLRLWWCVGWSSHRVCRSAWCTSSLVFETPIHCDTIRYIALLPLLQL